ncbi:CocE/NonD family hydrolase [Xanthocytophaga agilis]|uniref:CocE/NonD family hydrolase n=1 Tax=Xanthocytophaga agilis TaxID=3048010 RepID=A0AAE3RAB2_9BACT|nr:CocE/NonD family hydrolase [Xanthocytophaga agilis]MDJ1503677.1 CocE/NonD family hydrolase [Xanthocytophaga agilis]
MKKTYYLLIALLVSISFIPSDVYAQEDIAAYIKNNYTKAIYYIPMRDGIKLCTIVYSPKDASQKYPIMLNRTPYSVGPYGENEYKTSMGPSDFFVKDGYIFAYQDVRGKYMSEGEFMDVRPHNPAKKGKKDIDESSDTYDTIEWLLKNVKNNNGKFGQWGISYPGFYTTMGVLSNHPALKAASPQAPVTDWFIGDDFHHNGAFFLPHFFNFMANFGKPRPQPRPTSPYRFNHGTPDGYQFFLNLGSLSHINSVYYKDSVAFWNEFRQHPNYDPFWQARNVRPHLKNVKPAVMTVGGWFDAENLFGALEIYKTIEKNNPGANNMLVMGPWFHGGWARSDGSFLGNASFVQKTSPFYRENIEFKFFQYHLKGKADPKLPEAYVFETGSNQWRTYDQWPPKNTQAKRLYLQGDHKLAFATPTADGDGGYDEYVSDPAHPVPFIEEIKTGMTREYMTDDQRFAARRPDVVVYTTDALTEDITIAGQVKPSLHVSTSGTDSDFIVKIIDVYPDTAAQFKEAKIPTAGYQMLVRGEPFRARFRNSYEKPEPFTPNQPTEVSFVMPDINHTFKKGHRIMIQIQSTWFPLVDRNPQKYVENIYDAKDSDYQKATQRIYHSPDKATYIELNVVGK